MGESFCQNIVVDIDALGFRTRRDDEVDIETDARTAMNRSLEQVDYNEAESLG